MGLKERLREVLQAAKGDVYLEDVIGHVACPRCAGSGLQAKFLHRVWHRIYLDHQIQCGECGTSYKRYAALPLIACWGRWWRVKKAHDKVRSKCARSRVRG